MLHFRATTGKPANMEIRDTRYTFHKYITLKELEYIFGFLDHLLAYAEGDVDDLSLKS
jgi:hypothetical protein